MRTRYRLKRQFQPAQKAVEAIVYVVVGWLVLYGLPMLLRHGPIVID